MSQERSVDFIGSIYDVYYLGQQDFPGEMPRVGQIGKFDDGREFVFCKTAVNITAGQVIAGAAGLDAAVSGATSAGSYTVLLTFASVTAGQLVLGYLSVNGIQYRIKSNTATGDPSTGLVSLTLYDRLNVALVDADACQVVAYRPGSTVVGTEVLAPLGVAVVAAPAATAATPYYFWAQTKGVATVVATGSIAVATNVKPVAAGAVSVRAAVTEMDVGTALTADEDGLVLLNLSM